MGTAARLIAGVPAAAVLLSASGAAGLAAPPGSSVPFGSLAAHEAAPPATAANHRSVGYVAPVSASIPADPEGNPACPQPTTWGMAPDEPGILVTYWGDGPDRVTVLVRTRNGADFAQTADIAPDQLLRFFDFPSVGVTAIREVLIITNVRRCVAPPDPATSGR